MKYQIRHAGRQELEQLPEIERLAGQRFRQIEDLVDLVDDMTPMAELEAAHGRGHVWVAVAAGDRPVGFAYGAVIDGNFHLEELDVLPRHGRQGLGRELVEAVIADAMAAGFDAVTLATFRHVPWNAPFYARLGFRILPPRELTPGLVTAVQDEIRRGLPSATRVVMRLDLKILDTENP